MLYNSISQSEALVEQQMTSGRQIFVKWLGVNRKKKEVGVQTRTPISVPQSFDVHNRHLFTSQHSGASWAILIFNLISLLELPRKPFFNERTLLNKNMNKIQLLLNAH